MNVGDCSSLEKENFLRFSLQVIVAWCDQMMTSRDFVSIASDRHHGQIRKW